MKLRTMFKADNIIDASESHHKIYEFLKNKKEGVLATCDPNGKPHATVVYIRIEEDFSVVFTTKRQTKKYDNLIHNSNAMLVVYDAASQTTAQIIGKVEEVTDMVQSQKAFDDMLATNLQQSHKAVPPITKVYAGGYVSLKLVPRQIRMALYSKQDPSNESMFNTIDF